MNNLYELINKFIESIDNEEAVKELKDSYNKIKNNKELIEKIKKYNETYDEKLKEELINNEDIRNAKHLEANLNYMILDINKELKEISKKDGCRWK